MVNCENTDCGMCVTLSGTVIVQDFQPDFEQSIGEKHSKQSARGLYIDMRDMTSIDREAWEIISHVRKSYCKQGPLRSAVVYSDRSAMAKFTFGSENPEISSYEKHFFTTENPTCRLDVHNWLVYGITAVAL